MDEHERSRLEVTAEKLEMDASKALAKAGAIRQELAKVPRPIDRKVAELEEKCADLDVILGTTRAALDVQTAGLTQISNRYEENIRDIRGRLDEMEGEIRLGLRRICTLENAMITADPEEPKEPPPDEKELARDEAPSDAPPG